MPNRRTADNLKLLKNTYKPSRATKPAPDGLKPPPGAPAWLPEQIRRVWEEIAENAPHLRHPGALMLEVLAHLVHQFRTDPDIPSARIALMRHLMADLFLTPSTRPCIPPEPEGTGFEDV